MATFPSTGIYRPNYVFTESSEVTTNIIQFESGKEARYSKGSPRREFTLNYSNMDETTRDAIIAFLQARSSSTDSFSWENPNDSVTYTVRLKESAITYDCVDYGIYNMNVTFLEII